MVEGINDNEVESPPAPPRKSPAAATAKLVAFLAARTRDVAAR